jgi:hypothetical protein
LGIGVSDFEVENTKLKGDALRQVVEIVIRGDPTVLEIRIMGLLISLGRRLLQGCVSTNL